MAVSIKFAKKRLKNDSPFVSEESFFSYSKFISLQFIKQSNFDYQSNLFGMDSKPIFLFLNKLGIINLNAHEGMDPLVAKLLTEKRMADKISLIDDMQIDLLK